MIALVLLTINCSAQVENKLAIKKADELINFLRLTSLTRTAKTKSEQFTFKFYDTVMYKFFDTSAMMRILVKDTEKFAPEGKIDLQRLFLWQLHLYVLVVPNIELSVEEDKEDSSFLRIYIRDKTSKHDSPDFNISVNPLTSGILTINSSAQAFEGREEKIKQLGAKEQKPK